MERHTYVIAHMYFDTLTTAPNCIGKSLAGHPTDKLEVGSYSHYVKVLCLICAELYRKGSLYLALHAYASFRGAFANCK